MPWPDIDPQIVRLVLDGIEELARFAWHHLTGDAKSEAAEQKIKALGLKGAGAMLKAMQDELEQEAAKAQLAEALIKLGPLPQHVLDAFTAIDHPPGQDPVPNLGLDIEEVAELPKPSDVVSGEIDTK